MLGEKTYTQATAFWWENPKERHRFGYLGLDVGLEVLIPVVMKSYPFWDITPCSPLKVNRRFGGIYRLHFQGRKYWCGSRWQARWEDSIKLYCR
jgi:hypothetical protein